MNHVVTSAGRIAAANEGEAARIVLRRAPDGGSTHGFPFAQHALTYLPPGGTHRFEHPGNAALAIAEVRPGRSPGADIVRSDDRFDDQHGRVQS